MNTYCNSAAEALSQALGPATSRERRVIIAALRYLEQRSGPVINFYHEYDLRVQLRLSGACVSIKCHCGCFATLAA